MELVAHACRPGPEYQANSAVAIRALNQAPVDRVEFDVMVDANQQLWLAHDSIDQDTLSLDQGLTLLADLGLPLHADLKSGGEEQQIVAAHHQAGVLDRTLFCGHDLEVLARVRYWAPEAPLGWSIPQFNVSAPIVRPESRPKDLPALVVNTCRDYQLNGIMAHWSLVDESLCSALRQAGLFLHIWTVDQPELAQQLLRFQPETLISNHPGALRAVFSTR